MAYTNADEWFDDLDADHRSPPPPCPSCGHVGPDDLTKLQVSGDIMCDSCLNPIDHPRCQSCGKRWHVLDAPPMGKDAEGDICCPDCLEDDDGEPDPSTV